MASDMININELSKTYIDELLTDPAIVILP